MPQKSKTDSELLSKSIENIQVYPNSDDSVKSEEIEFVKKEKKQKKKKKHKKKKVVQKDSISISGMSGDESKDYMGRNEFSEESGIANIVRDDSGSSRKKEMFFVCLALASLTAGTICMLIYLDVFNWDFWN